MSYIASYPYSTIFYTFILIFSVLFAFLAQIVAKRVSANIMIGIIVLILSITAGLRSSMVGLDTMQYIRIIESTSSTYSGELYYRYFEIGFQILIKILMFLVKEPHYVLLLISLITNSLIIRTLWFFREKISFSLSIFCYITMFYFETYNILRQWLAIAIIFFAIRYLLKSRYVLFLIFVIIASTIHYSAIISLVFIPIHLFIKKKLSFNIILTFLITIPLALFGMKTFIGNYSYYLNSNISFGSKNINFGLSFIVNLGIIIFSLFLYLKKEYKFSDSNFQKQIIFICLIGQLMSILGYIYMFAGRIASYATVYQIILFSMMSKTKTLSIIIKFVIVLLGLYLFYTGLNISSQGQMPYKLSIFD
ncbi:EpsG family protein [Neobacillus massiliamazoniensis]|uniref:Capsular polysaccharide biosynthesis protein YveQ n=1 Tax=Neobacillus massiliamazoniensis TaxID=1499688 RepID=A0A0U1NQ54_9BACI|nr:EpsG family protein [Neobacillus massiliamazoniensis]CRK80176.1 capsular polysaccharide biosynthesis protein YveQ [Neobacillus massiliamazoniensis]